MSKEYNYIILYRDGVGWELDWASEEQFFHNGTIYDTETKQWEHGYQGEGEYNTDEKAVTEQLVKALAIMNGED